MESFEDKFGLRLRVIPDGRTLTASAFPHHDTPVNLLPIVDQENHLTKIAIIYHIKDCPEIKFIPTADQLRSLIETKLNINQ